MQLQHFLYIIFSNQYIERSDPNGIRWNSVHYIRRHCFVFQLMVLNVLLDELISTQYVKFIDSEDGIQIQALTDEECR